MTGVALIILQPEHEADALGGIKPSGVYRKATHVFQTGAVFVLVEVVTLPEAQ